MPRDKTEQPRSRSQEATCSSSPTARAASLAALSAQTVVHTLSGLDPTRTHDWTEVLRQIDFSLSATPSAGETTAVVALLTDHEIIGASVGDSGAWMLAGIWLNLLEDQRRKPLLGTGSAIPVGFGPFPMGERVLLGSDGLFKYVDADRIGELACNSSPKLAASELIRSARLPSGALQDDIAVIVAG